MAVTSSDAGMKALRKELAYLRANHTRIGVLSGPAKGGNVQGTAQKKAPTISAARINRHKEQVKKHGIERLRVKFKREDAMAAKRKHLNTKFGNKRTKIKSASAARKKRIDARSAKSMGNASTRLSMARAALSWSKGTSDNEARTKAALGVHRADMARAVNDARRSVNARIRAKKIDIRKPRVGGGGPNLTVAEVFNFHENGLRGELGPGHNHKRSSIGWVEENKREEIRGFLVKVMDLVVQGRMNGRDALFFAGEKAQSLIKARIVSGIPPALNPEYLKFKSHAGGKAKPLIWTGQLLNSVRYQVVKSL